MPSVNPTERAIEADPLIHPELKEDLIRIYRSYVETSKKMLESEQKNEREENGHGHRD